MWSWHFSGIFRGENETLSEDYKKRMEMFRELQRKSKWVALLNISELNFKFWQVSYINMS